MKVEILKTTLEELSEIGNEVKRELIETLVADDILSEENAKIVQENYGVVIHNKSFFGKTIEKLKFGEVGSDFIITIVEIK